jgi:thiamine pyrophosphate-dependent acetolactate synthase large subunit-like protein
VDPRQLIERLDDLLPAARTIVTDGGYFVRFAWVHLAPPDAAGFVFTQSFMAVGLGIATAIGAALARPDRLTVLVIGDGGLAMSLGELETAVRLKIPMLIVVMNDQAYGAEVHALEDLGLPSDEARFAEVDFAGIAQQLGANGQTVRSLSQLGSIRTWLDSPSEPFLLDCRIDGRVR